MSKVIPLLNSTKLIGKTYQKNSFLKKSVKVGLTFAALSNQVQQTQSAIIPTGTIASFNLHSCPDGWDERTDLAGKGLIGRGSYTGTAEDGRIENVVYTKGETGGEVEHTETIGEMVSHFHYIYGQDNSAPPSGSGVNEVANIENPTASTAYFERMSESKGGGGSHNNMPPYEVVTVCEKNDSPTDEENRISTLETELSDLKKKLE